MRCHVVALQENADDYQLKMDVPGIDKADIDIDVRVSLLTMRARVCSMV